MLLLLLLLACEQRQCGCCRLKSVVHSSQEIQSIYGGSQSVSPLTCDRKQLLLLPLLQTPQTHRPTVNLFLLWFQVRSTAHPSWKASANVVFFQPECGQNHCWSTFGRNLIGSFGPWSVDGSFDKWICSLLKMFSVGFSCRWILRWSKSTPEIPFILSVSFFCPSTCRLFPSSRPWHVDGVLRVMSN